jgi:hypothetical protein
LSPKKTEVDALKYGTCIISDQYRCTNYPVVCVQNNVVCTLGTESFRPSAAAQCVQLIAMVELPRGLWPGLIQTLVHNVTNPASTEIVKESTLQAIGYICQVSCRHTS